MSEPLPMKPEDVKRHLADIDSKLRAALAANERRTVNCRELPLLNAQDYAEAYGGVRYIAECAALYSETEARAKWDAEAADLEAQAQAWMLDERSGRTVVNWSRLLVGETQDQYEARQPVAGEGNDHAGIVR